MPVLRAASVRAWIFGAPVVLMLACGGSKRPAESPASTDTAAARSGPAEIGRPAPDLSIQTLNGKGSVGIDKLNGKIVVVDFWATWCAPCRKSFPALEEIAKRYKGKVEVVGVSVNDERDGVADFAKELGTTFPIGWDDGHAIAQRWNVSSMPSSFVLDGTGTVRYVHNGYHEGDEAVIEKELITLLGDPNAKAAPPKDKDKDAADADANAIKRTAPPADAPAATTGSADAAAASDAPPPPPTKPAKKKKRAGKPVNKPAKKPTKTQNKPQS